MKLFNNQPDAHEYFKQAILNDENELEAIFGYTPAKNPINKKIFINLYLELYLFYYSELFCISK